MAITQQAFGTTAGGQAVTLFTLKNTGGMCVQVLDYGGTVRAIAVPDRAGRPVEVCLGYDTLAEYERYGDYLGAVVGRVAGRIAGARADIGGRDIALAANDGENQLHGGPLGFSRRVFAGEIRGDSLVLRYRSPDGDQGYPGTLDFTVAYTLTENNALKIDYRGQSDADTALSPTNHSYFNVDGGGTVRDQLLCIDADRVTEMTPGSVATGRLLDVAGTPFDFRAPKPVGRDIEAQDSQIRAVGGYDHSYILAAADHMETPAATLRSGKTGICMRVYTTAPVIQFYAGNFLPDVSGRTGQMGRFAGLALEAQGYPNAFAVPGFPAPLLKKGEVFAGGTVYAFSTEEE